MVKNKFAGSDWEISKWHYLRWSKSKDNWSSTKPLVSRYLSRDLFVLWNQNIYMDASIYEKQLCLCRFGPAGDPRGAGIGTPEAIKLVWSCHREIIYDYGPVSKDWEIPPSS